MAYMDSYDDLLVASGAGYDTEERVYDHCPPDSDYVKSMAVGSGRVAIASTLINNFIFK